MGKELTALRQALRDGELSGEPKPLDIAAIKAAARARLKANQ